jgi:hypothetical protein
MLMMEGSKNGFLPPHSTLNQKVGSTGFEPARPCGHKALNLARLPISPRARSEAKGRHTAANMKVYSPWGGRSSAAARCDRSAVASRELA